MLAFNFFNWIEGSGGVKLTLPNCGQTFRFDHVYFEVRMKTIQKSPAPANMDVLLTGDDAWLMIESKFLEHLDRTRVAEKDVQAYLDENRYYSNGVFWRKRMRAVCNEQGPGYCAGLKQNICHLVAMSNLLVGQEKCLAYFKKENEFLKEASLKPMFFINAVYRPSDRYFKLPTENPYKAYELLWEKHFGDMNGMKGVVLPTMGFMSYSELWQQLRDQMPDDVRSYLNRRYMSLSELQGSDHVV